MMSKGFIVEATFDDNKGKEDDYAATDLHIEDNLNGGEGNDEDQMINVFIEQSAKMLHFTRPEAEAFVEAFNEILSRYPRSEVKK